MVDVPFLSRYCPTQEYMMKVGSLFTGIGGLDLGFERAGAEIAWQCEIDPHARAVLASRFPGVPCYTDVKEVATDEECPVVDVLCGGFPCQDVSVAGRRAGLAGERSGLWFEFHRIAQTLRPQIIVIENVPGLLSSNKGRDFAVVLQGLVELGYGVCWRILDAQYFGVAQRRRRVFIVGSLGDGRAAEILLERESLLGDPPARGAAEQEVAGSLGGGSGNRGWCDDLDRAGTFIADALTASYANTSSAAGNNPRPVNVVVDSFAIQERAVSENPDSGPDGAGWKHEQAYTLEARSTTQIVASALSASMGHHGHSSPRGDGSDTLVVETLRQHPRPGSNTTGPIIISRRGREDGVADELEEGIAPALRAGDGGSSRGLIVFDPTQVSSPENRSNPQPGDPSHPLVSRGYVPHIAYALAARNAKGVSLLDGQDTFIGSPGAVRRLTPTECERLQGFPDGWTANGQTDGHRYRQLGNAVCVNVAEHLAKKVALSCQ